MLKIKLNIVKDIPYAILKSGKDQSVKRYHPWIFSGAIKKIHGSVSEGDLIKVFDNKNNFLAIGHYQPGSIAIRIISFEDVIPDENFWQQRISRAHEHRKNLNLSGDNHTNIYRLIYAEGDDMPGLIADYYNGVLVLQFHSVGMYLIRELIVKGLQEVLVNDLKAIYDKSENTLPRKSGVGAVNEYLLGQASSSVVKENGLTFRVNWETGQKTGFFIDQRENRKVLMKYAGNKKVLNLFGYTGGFSLYGMKAGAEQVHTVDSSKTAIDLANENIGLNFPGDKRHKAFPVDAFEFLEKEDFDYDLIILDPPAFAKHGNVLNNALQGYKRLNQKAISRINPGGIIFTFSCSQVVSRENFKKSVFAAAANTGRKVKILQFLSQPADHPINIYHPEGEYLKGFVLKVDE